jgi:hypothetical protein
MIKAPSITINGKTVKAKEPKLKIWRKLVKLQTNEADLNSEEGLDLLLDFFSNVFQVDAEIIEDNVDLSEFFSLFAEIGTWIAKIVEARTEKNQ